MTAAALSKQVLGMPREEREALLDRLIASLHGDDELSSGADPAWEQAWTDRVRSRIADIDEGRVATIPAERVLADMRSGVLPGSR